MSEASLRQVIPRTSKAEGWWLIALLAVYALTGIVCLRVFSVHLDEPSYTDPAASFLLGQGFTSGAWYAQTHDKFWAGNVPLHQFLLVIWLKIFGFSQLAVRSIAVLYVMAGIVLLWVALRRGDFLKAPAWRLGLVTFLLFSFGTVQMLVAGRPDAITFLLMCWGYWAMSLERPARRYGGLAILGFLAPWAGLQLVTILAFFGIAALLTWRRRFLPEVFSVACGGVLGAVALLGLYASQGTVEAFLASIRHHTAARDSRSEAFSAMSHRAGAFRDPSYLLLTGAAAVTIVGCAMGRQTRARFSECLMCLIALIGIPAWMMAVGIFPIYYSWLAVIPLSVCLFRLLEAGMAGHNGFRIGSLALLVFGAAMGAPRVFSDALLHLSDGVNEKAEKFVKGVLRSGDVAMISQPAYYAAKQSARRVYYVHWYMEVVTEPEKTSLTVAVMDQETFATVGPKLGGVWRFTGESISLPDRTLVRSKWFTNSLMTELAVFRKVLPSVE